MVKLEQEHFAAIWEGCNTREPFAFLFKLRSAHENPFLVQLTEKPVKLVAHLQCTQLIDGGAEVHGER